MKEALIIHPTKANGHRRLTANLITAFGGVTVVNGKGYWLDGSKNLITEAVKLYTVACEDIDLTYFNLKAIALEAKADGAQDKQYLRYPTGKVVLL